MWLHGWSRSWISACDFFHDVVHHVVNVFAINFGTPFGIIFISVLKLKQDHFTVDIHVAG